MRTLVLLATLALLTLAAPASADDGVGFEETCVPTNGGGMDYYSEACVDPDRSGCRVWHESYNEYSGHKYVCYVPV